MNQKEYIGFDSIKSLESVLAELPAKKVFLVTGKTSYIKSGAKDRLSGLLAKYIFQRFWNFDRNPNANDLERGIEVFNQDDYDVVIAVGGGSVIDTAKLINFSAVNNLNIREHLRNPRSNIRKPKPLIAIPTTAGTGSETTHFAVLYFETTKYSLAHKYILPDVAIVDPALTMSMPKYITATTAMDALGQAIESYWSINSNDKSKRFAKDAIELIISNLTTAVNSPSVSARFAMAKAANLSGKAINITNTTASHAVSYPLTSYFGIPHGHAVALTLPAMLEYNAGANDDDVLDSRGYKYVQKTTSEIIRLWGQNNVADTKQAMSDLIYKVGLETKLSRLGVNSPEDIKTIITNSFNSDRMANNPRKVTKKGLRKILETTY